MAEPNPAPKPRGAGCAAVALVTLGLLILVPSGLCTGFFALYPIVEPILDPNHRPVSGDFGIAISIGVPFVIVGGLLTWLGFSMMRRR
jgi:hypothetical protein